MKQYFKRFRKRYGARRFITEGVSVVDFFEALRQRNVNYVVLRWYENLPHVAAGEDIDILMADEDLEKVSDLLEGRMSKHQAVDLYSVSGLPNSNFRSLPYYHTEIAKGILDRSVLWKELYRVPSPRDAFFSMAYHVVYHKGLASGVPDSQKTLPQHAKPADHDYMAVLREKAMIAGISLSPDDYNLTSLHAILESQAWSPPIDTLTKLSSGNKWLSDLLAKSTQSVPSWMEGLTCFIVRDRGINFLPLIRRQIEADGFDILWESPLENGIRETVRREIRGGVWNKGPWPKSGGDPAHIIVAYDVFRVPPSRRALREHPGLSNQRIIWTKEAIRNIYNGHHSLGENSNIVHSTDNALQAMHCLKLVSLDFDDVMNTAMRKYNDSSLPFPIIKELGGNSRRSKVSLVNYKGEEVVIKRFREGRERFMEREVNARKISKLRDEVSDIIDIGDRYILLKYYKKSDGLYWLQIPMFRFDGFIRPVFLKRLRDLLLHFREHGLDFIDFQPSAVLLDPDHGLKVVDFEFLQEFQPERKGLEGSPALYCVPEEFLGDLPNGLPLRTVSPYDLHWRSEAGVPLRAFVEDTPLFQLAMLQFISLIRILVGKMLRKFKGMIPFIGGRMSARRQIARIMRRLVD